MPFFCYFLFRPRLFHHFEGFISKMFFIIIVSKTLLQGCTLIVEPWSPRALRAAAFVLSSCCDKEGCIAGFPVPQLLRNNPIEN